MSASSSSKSATVALNLLAWGLALLWVLPLLFAIWTAIHPPVYVGNFDIFAPLTLENFVRVWNAAPFDRYFLNTFMLVTFVVISQFVICTLAAYAFAVFPFRGSQWLFMLVLVQLMVMPEVLLVRNYATIAQMGLVDTIPAIALPYLASAFGIFLFRQAFKSVPKELDEAARMEGAGPLKVLWRVYVPLSKSTYLAYGLVMVAYHWNNFLWPLVITNSATTRPITVGLQIFSTVEQGIDWPTVTAATLLSVAPLLIAFLIFQRQFVQSFMRSGIR
ncbi:MAG: carbohydrate ABC transporter permease [Rhodobacteraceae bacterium]|nr:carbohydrate ABC transporter permease [Paracoccaceae bacterium]